MTGIAGERANRPPKDVEYLRQELRTGVVREHAYAALVGLRTVVDTAYLLDRVEKGLPYRALERLQKNLGLPKRRLAELVGIPPRTLARRKAEGRLHPDESDRLLRLSRVFMKALELFEGDFLGTKAWLMGPNPGLGGQTPIDFARTEVGAREVENLIGRLEHGIPG